VKISRGGGKGGGEPNYLKTRVVNGGGGGELLCVGKKQKRKKKLSPLGAGGGGGGAKLFFGGLPQKNKNRGDEQRKNHGKRPTRSGSQRGGKNKYLSWRWGPGGKKPRKNHKWNTP